jgi:hypothetical protein
MATTSSFETGANRMSRVLGAGAVSCFPAALALLFAVAGPAAGQVMAFTDVTGPVVTTGDQVAPLFMDPGPVRALDCPVAWGIRTTADVVAVDLMRGRLVPVALRPGTQLDPQAQQRVISLLTATRRDRGPAAEMIAILSQGQRPEAIRAARRLVDESRGLFNVVQALDPLRPDPAGATRLDRAVAAYNGFVDASSTGFLAGQPDELIALHAVLNSLVIASLEHEGRPADPRIVDERGLACAVLREDPVVPPPPPPIEQAMLICIMLDRDFREVNALFRPATGDTMVIVDGQRLPLSQVYPDADRFTLAEWLIRRDSVTIGVTPYIPFGLSRTVRPGELARVGQVDGVDFYVQPGESTPPAVVYFPVARGCEVQPYRAAETVRPRG